MKKKKELPEWFAGETYEKGDVISSPQTKEEIELNNFELSMYDFIMGSEMLVEMLGDKSPSIYIEYLNKGLDWFEESNPTAYKFFNFNK